MKKGEKHTEKSIKLMKEVNKGKRLSPKTEFKKGHVPWMKGKHHTKESNRKNRESNRRYYKDHPEARNKMRGDKNVAKRLEVRKLLKKSQKKRWENPKEIERQSLEMKKRWENEEYRKKMIETYKQLWQNEEFIKKIFKARRFRPTKPEKQLIDICKKHNFPFKYVGAGDFILAGKCPDFINCNGKKQVIEVYGNYWHRNDNPQDRIDLFKQYGFDTLVLWERELKDEENIVEKVKEFV